MVNLGIFGRRVLAGLAVSAGAGLTAGAASATPTLWADNGHYYEFVGVGLTFDAALSAAASATPIAGYESYLATITSEEENTFIADLELAARGTLADTWVAGSDREVEGVWRWIAGPEAGQIFWMGGGSGSGGAAPAGAYPNGANSVEPNNERRWYERGLGLLRPRWRLERFQRRQSGRLCCGIQPGASGTRHDRRARAGGLGPHDPGFRRRRRGPTQSPQGGHRRRLNADFLGKSVRPADPAGRFAFRRPRHPFKPPDFG